MKKHYETHVEDTDKLISVAGPVLDYKSWYEQYRKLMEEQAQRKYGLYTPTSEDDDDDFPSIPGMIARWSAKGLTNEEMSKNPVWKDLTGNGHDLQMKNFAWGGMSGVGGYGDENYQTFYKFTLDDYVFIASPPGVKHMNFTFRVTGLQPGNKLTLAFFGTTNTVYGTWDKDGIYTVNSAVVEVGKPVYFYNGYGSTRGEFTIEIFPLYPGALVFDGVDDYGVCENFPILTKEKGYTVVALRQWDQDFLNTALTGGLLSTRNYSTGEGVAFEKIESSNKGYWNLGAGGIIDFAKSPFTWQTSKQYNNVGILKGDKNHGKPLCVGCGLSGGQQCGRFAIWELVFLDHDATEEELTKIKDYFVKTYPWLFPDQAWTVVGKTNEDEDRATIANITGNGNDLVLSNFGFAEGSGYNEEGEYAGYLVTDGVDDIASSNTVVYEADFTFIGEWKFIQKDDTVAGINSVSHLYIQNRYNRGATVMINSTFENKKNITDYMTFKAITSKGKAYDENWNEVDLLYGDGNKGPSGVNIGGQGGTEFCHMIFKNMALYMNKVFSKNDCIKAYNYLQTLKSK